VGSLLVAQWLAGAEALAVRDDASVSQVREWVRQLGEQQRLSRETIESAANAASELAFNQLRHASGGQVAVRAIERAGVAGLEVVAADAGPGIADPEAALRGVPRTAGSLGCGLAAAHRMVHEVDSDVRWGEGTCLWARVFGARLPRSEVAILGRAHPAEHLSGDQAAFVRRGETVLAAILDGLGHGPAAREPTDRAVAVLRAHPGLSPAELIKRCDGALRGTRGAVMSAVRIELAAGTVEHAGSGNLSTALYEADGAARRFASATRVVGSTQPERPLRPESACFGQQRTLVVHTDGITSRADLRERLDLLRLPALVLAHRLVAEFGRESDDALVLVAR
jgi:anti-sigma regulatory factor (Ser/Thr protein kinase)